MMTKRTERLDDALLLLGAALIAVGLWLCWPPASFVVCGVLVIAYALGGRSS